MFMASQKCPSCDLYNPEFALRCDCGYDFQSRQIEKSYLSIKQQGLETDLNALFQNAEKKIKGGWVCSLISAFLTLLFALLGNSGVQIDAYNNYNLFNLLDVFILSVCTFGIYRKSRVASTSMLVYFLGNKIWMWWGHLPGGIGIILSLILIYFYFEAMRGTFIYHRLLHNNNQENLKADFSVS